LKNLFHSSFAVLILYTYHPIYFAVVEVDVNVVAFLGLPNFWVDLKLPKVLDQPPEGFRVLVRLF